MHKECITFLSVIRSEELIGLSPCSLRFVSISCIISSQSDNTKRTLTFRTSSESLLDQLSSIAARVLGVSAHSALFLISKTGPPASPEAARCLETSSSDRMKF